MAKKQLSGVSLYAMSQAEMRAKFKYFEQQFYPNNVAFVLSLPADQCKVMSHSNPDARYFKVYDREGNIVTSYLGDAVQTFELIRDVRGMYPIWIH